jgi:hypothetical protein
MSHEPKKRDWPKWMLPACWTFAVLAAYQGSHYATAATVHYPRACCACCSHKIGGKQVPEWVDNYFFWPAQCLDDLIGVDPWRWH